MNPGAPMDKKPHRARELLADLLIQLQDDPSLDDARLNAADLAIEIALSDNDPFTADVVESLLSDLPVNSAPQVIESLRTKSALAQSARRAIAQRHGKSRGSQAPSASQRTSRRM